jgi:hypothetical protein
MATLAGFPEVLPVNCERLKREVNLPIAEWKPDAHYMDVAHYLSDVCPCGLRHFGPAYFASWNEVIASPTQSIV